jgi:hypothetical protein
MELAGNIVHCRVAKMKPASTGLRLIGRDALSECEPLHTNEFGACRIACRCWSLVNFVVPRVRRWVYLQQRFAGHRMRSQGPRRRAAGNRHEKSRCFTTTKYHSNPSYHSNPARRALSRSLDDLPKFLILALFAQRELRLYRATPDKVCARESQSSHACYGPEPGVTLRYPASADSFNFLQHRGLVRRHYTIDGSAIDGSTINGCAIRRSTIDGSAIHGSTIHGSTIDRCTIHGSAIDRCTVSGSAIDRSTIDRSTIHRCIISGRIIPGSAIDRSTISGWTISRPAIAGRRFTQLSGRNVVRCEAGRRN